MDEAKFKSHTEKEFWEKVLLVELQNGWTNAIAHADTALAARSARMASELTSYEQFEDEDF